MALIHTSVRIRGANFFKSMQKGGLWSIVCKRLASLNGSTVFLWIYMYAYVSVVCTYARCWPFSTVLCFGTYVCMCVCTYNIYIYIHIYTYILTYILCICVYTRARGSYLPTAKFFVFCLCLRDTCTCILRILFVCVCIYAYIQRHAQSD